MQYFLNHVICLRLLLSLKNYYVILIFSNRLAFAEICFLTNGGNRNCRLEKNFDDIHRKYTFGHMAAEAKNK